MPETIFGDAVAIATDLKKRQRYWFNRARETGGVTIVQGNLADLVLAPRQKVAVAAEGAVHAREAAQFLREIITLRRSPGESAIFPWLGDLDPEEQQEFVREFVDVFARGMTTGEWTQWEELREDWQATAEAHRNPELSEAWRNRGRPEDYVPMEVPGAS